LTERLAELRGAGMKVGQLLSMEAGDLLAPELTPLLAPLREDARSMLAGQLQRVLERAWGQDWRRRFRHFSSQPMAAASIGQFHRAVAADGGELAIEVQYPGVRRSIDSDVATLAALLERFRLWPAEVDATPLLREARRQLHLEANCAHEAAQLNAYRAHFDLDPEFWLPEGHTTLTIPDVLVSCPRSRSRRSPPSRGTGPPWWRLP
jgi:predicted unusual protein kinase regulating ubiquinone biosynthesis (AarF/ABC1/UbiB family)